MLNPARASSAANCLDTYQSVQCTGTVLVPVASGPSHSVRRRSGANIHPRAAQERIVHRDIGIGGHAACALGPYQDFDSFHADFDVQILILSSRFWTNFGPVLEAQAHANIKKHFDSGPVKFAPAHPDPLLLAGKCQMTRRETGWERLTQLTSSPMSSAAASYVLFPGPGYWVTPFKVLACNQSPPRLVEGLHEAADLVHLRAVVVRLAVASQAVA